MDSRPILAGVNEVTRKWTRQRKAEERSSRFLSRRASMWTGPARTSLKDICYDAMPDIWAKASGGGRLPTHWRQLFYVARGIVDDYQESDRPLLDKTFKAILESYVADTGVTWDILAGARGVLKEPHDGRRRRVVPLSTADVRAYLRTPTPTGELEHLDLEYPTHGAANCYGAILVCEKEGFDETLQAEQVGDRFDIALMSTKGISARAARDLVTSLDVPCFTLHDFDKNGFVMAAGFPTAIDIGLRLHDVEELELRGETQRHRNLDATYKNLRKNGATKAEADFIAGGRRVELNELAGDEFIAFVERKLEEHGVEKIVPAAATLADAWRRALSARDINKLIDRANSKDRGAPPDDLEQQVRGKLTEDDRLSWSEALLEVLDDLDGEAPAG